MCQGRVQFHELFVPVILGRFPKMAMKSSIIGLDPYIIPNFNANMAWHA